MGKIKILFIAVFALSFVACGQQKKAFLSPAGYDLNRPQQFVMPESLFEISGVAFHTRIPEVIYAEQDEEGKVFSYNLQTKDVHSVKFGKGGDYEDLAIGGEQVYVLRSDGRIVGFSFSDLRSGEIRDVKEWKEVLPKAEYEGMFFDPGSKLLYVLCKDCPSEFRKGEAGGYMLKVSGENVTRAGRFAVSGIFPKEGKEKNRKMKPSAIAKNPLTGKWFILSSVNRLLVVANKKWQVEHAYPLNPDVFRQPEGIAFDPSGNLYISNEGSQTHAANILKFSLK